MNADLNLLVLLGGPQPVEELGAGLECDPLPLLLLGVLAPLPVQQRVLADTVLVVEGLEDVVEQLVRVLQPVHQALDSVQAEQLTVLYKYIFINFLVTHWLSDRKI